MQGHASYTHVDLGGWVKSVCKRVHTLLQLSDQRLSLRLTLVCVSKTECKLRVLAGLNLIDQVIYSFLPLSLVLSVSLELNGHGH